MPIAASSLILYASLNRPQNDSSTSGGGIDVEVRLAFTQLSAPSTIRVVSDGADTRDVTVTGRLITGVIDTEILTLNGATNVDGAKVFERLLSVIADSVSGSRAVTVQENTGATTVGTIPINEKGFAALFIDSASSSSPVTRYEKTFFKNTDASLTLNSAIVTLTADPASRITIGLAAAKDGTTSVTNRLTAPGGITFSDDNVDLPVPSTFLAAGEAIGVWVRQSLLTNDNPFKNTLTLRLSGNSA